MSYEVHIRIIFDEPCLGNEREPDPAPNRHSRDSAGNVVLKQIWWNSIMVKAAQAFCRHQSKVFDIAWTPEVDGTVKLYERYYVAHENGRSITRVKKHEAFYAGDIVGVKARLPDDMSIEDFQEILTIAGQSYGISPYGWKKGLGRFKVVEVKRAYGSKHGGDQYSGKHAVDSQSVTAVGEDRGSVDNVQPENPGCPAGGVSGSSPGEKQPGTKAD